jgi:tight adherence protein B
VRPAPAPPVAELLTALAAELAAGQPTGAALESAASGLVPHPCPRALAASRSGADVATALRADAQVPGARALRGLAACWEVSERSGAGLSVAVARLAGGLRASAEADAQLVAEIAAVRTSARLLAGLPLLGLLIGQWIGADPLTWLTGSWVGRIVFVLGVALQVAGITWLHRMVAATRDRL